MAAPIMAARPNQSLCLVGSSRNPCPSYRSRPDWLLSPVQQSTAVSSAASVTGLALPPLLDNGYHSQDIARPTTEHIGSSLQKLSLGSGDAPPRSRSRRPSTHTVHHGRVSKPYTCDNYSRRSSTSSSTTSSTGSDLTLNLSEPTQQMQRRKKADKEKLSRAGLAHITRRFEIVLEKTGRAARMRTKLNKNNRDNSGGLKHKKEEIFLTSLELLEEFLGRDCKCAPIKVESETFRDTAHVEIIMSPRLHR